MRLLQNKYGSLVDVDYPDSKINLCIAEVVSIWQETADQRYTQVVVLDQSTPKPSKKEIHRVKMFPPTPKRLKLQRGDTLPRQKKVRFINEVETTVATWNLYGETKQKMVRLGIPAHEIAFIHNCKTDLQKQELFDKVNGGEIRIIFGSTPKLGAGTNIQKRLFALHHVDCPWRPSDMEQRDFSKLLPSEKAKALKMQMDAMKRQGKRAGAFGLVGQRYGIEGEDTSGLVDRKSDPVDTRMEIAAENDLSPRTVARLIRLTELIDPLMVFVDQKSISLYAAVDLSFLGKQEQAELADCLHHMKKPLVSMEKAQELRRIFEAGEWDRVRVRELLTPKSKPPGKSTLKIIIPKEQLPAPLLEMPAKELTALLLELLQKQYMNAS